LTSKLVDASVSVKDEFKKLCAGAVTSLKGVFLFTFSFKS